MTDLDAIRAMSDAELDAAIAREVMDREVNVERVDMGGVCLVCYGVAGEMVNYTRDLNAVAEVEAKLRAADLIANYADSLTVVCEGHDWSKIVIAPARQRAEACLLAWRRMKG